MIETLERLTISEALRIAEQQTWRAHRDKDAVDPEREQRVQQWSDTLHALRAIKERGVPDSMEDDVRHGIENKSRTGRSERERVA